MTTLRVAATALTLIFCFGQTLAAVRQGGDFSGWWILAASLGSLGLLLTIWWPHRKEHDRE